jgi:hypothetical protein
MEQDPMGEKIMKKLLTAAIISIALIGGTAQAAGPVSYKNATTALNTLKVADEVRTGYKRTLFKHWITISRAGQTGCDSRKSVIIDEAIVKPKVESGCKLVGGEWLSIYDNVKVTDAGNLDVDHMVPLAEAWDSGASSWDALKKQQYANDMVDPRHLIAVTGGSNRSKSDQDPAEWMPTNKAYACEYLVNWVSIKVRWNLSVDKIEKAFIATNLKTCKTTKFSVVLVK